MVTGIYLGMDTLFGGNIRISLRLKISIVYFSIVFIEQSSLVMIVYFSVRKFIYQVFVLFYYAWINGWIELIHLHFVCAPLLEKFVPFNLLCSIEGYRQTCLFHVGLELAPISPFFILYFVFNFKVLVFGAWAWKVIEPIISRQIYGVENFFSNLIVFISQIFVFFNRLII